MRGQVLRLWWERVGEARASGILKLMMSEVRNFPEMARLYVEEVARPADRMIAGIVERSIARGELRAVKVDDVVHALCAPILFLVMNKHSHGACSVEAQLDPMPIIEAHIDLVLHGLQAPTARPARAAKGAGR